MSPRWHGSLRFRLLVLTAVVAAAAAGLTAWLTVYQATQQVTNSAAAEEAAIKSISFELVDYGALRGNWDGLSGPVRALKDRTGQRIRITTMTGQTLVDSDTLDGGQPRPLSGRAPTLLDPVPTPILPSEGLQIPLTVTTQRSAPSTATPGFTASAPDRWLAKLRDYPSRVLVARCMIGMGYLVQQKPTADGVPDVDLIGDNTDPGRKSAVGECASRGVGSLGEAYLGCGLGKENPPVETCLVNAFRARTQQIMPASLLLSLGTGEPPPSRAVPLLPALLAAGGVALVSVLGMLLVSRRVLRPVGALMTASTRLGAGDLAERVPVRGHDEIADLAGAFNRMADSLQRSEERQRRMIADIAHELRTPLANIRGYLEALRDGVLPPDQELFASLHEEALLQQRLIEDIQLLALADAGSLAYERAPVDLGEVVASTRTGFQAVAAAAGVDLVSTVDDPAPVVTGDGNRLRQVLGNLVSNAIRATPAGGVVTLGVRGEDGQAVLTVADTGAGIREEDLPHVFDRFWRADDARTRATGGSGLGLSIAREIVAAHGGVIGAESPGGALFTVRLPVVQA